MLLLASDPEQRRPRNYAVQGDVTITANNALPATLYVALSFAQPAAVVKRFEQYPVQAAGGGPDQPRFGNFERFGLRVKSPTSGWRACPAGILRQVGSSGWCSGWWCAHRRSFSGWSSGWWCSAGGGAPAGGARSVADQPLAAKTEPKLSISWFR